MTPHYPLSLSSGTMHSSKEKGRKRADLERLNAAIVRDKAVNAVLKRLADERALSLAAALERACVHAGIPVELLEGFQITGDGPIQVTDGKIVVPTVSRPVKLNLNSRCPPKASIVSRKPKPSAPVATG